MKLNLTTNIARDQQGGIVPDKRIILGKLPEWIRSHGNMELKNVAKINKYLHWQEVRIRKAFNEGDSEKAIKIWLKLLQESWGYQMVLFHRSNPGWYYSLDQDLARKKLSEAMNDIRRWNYEILIKRFYIEKKNGKLRPIGSPNIKSKMLGKAFADMMLWCGGSDIPYQHGFTPGRGIHTAIMEIVKLYERGFRNIYEFDLKGWFNHVRPVWVKETLRKHSKTLSILFGHLIYKTHIKFDQLKPETELERITNIDGYRVSKTAKDIIARKGMTQGMPYSPVAANIALSGFQQVPEGLTMYADDGVILSKVAVIPDWVKDIELAGAVIAPEKSGWVTGPFKFLGVMLDLENRKITYDGNDFNWQEWSSSTALALQAWLKRVPNTYSGSKGIGWHWDVNKLAYISVLLDELTFKQKIAIWWNSIWRAKTFHGYRYLWGFGIVDVQSASSRCIELISRDRHLMHRARCKPYQLTTDKEHRMAIDRGSYIEVIPYAYHPNGHTNVIGTNLLVSVKIRPVRQ